jgi:tRNA modification GTPase
MNTASADTICALSTPHGVGGIAVVRISGGKAFEIVSLLFSKAIQPENARKAMFGVIKDGNSILDEVVVTSFVGPHSFTGEDVVEIACHGSRYIQQRLLELLMECGCRMAMPGEYTQRAYLNGRMDLSRAEAVGDVIAAESAAAHRQAVHQMRGGFSKEINSLRERLIEFASLLELELDFSEEDVEFADRTQLRVLLNEIKRVVLRLKQSFKLGNALKNGIPVAIVGAPNAGKSTLLNALLNEDRALVSDIAGTTRDTVEEVLNIQGYSYRFIDTAGIRDTEDVVEKMGIERSLEKIQHAQLILLLVDSEKESEEEVLAMLARMNEEKRDEAKILLLWNKSDRASKSLNNKGHVDELAISAKAGVGIEEIKNWLIRAFENEVIEGETVVTNARHFEALRQADLSLDDLIGGMESGIPSDLLAVDLRKILYHLAEITGEVKADDILNSIFGKFCIGK